MRKIIVLNQKMYMEYNDVKNYIKTVKDKMRTDLDIIICPSNLFLPYYNGRYTFKLGAQDLYYDNVTGEVTGGQLRTLGVCYSIVGHSERKLHLYETNDMINKKIKEALKNNIVPIVCVGETKEERLLKKTGEVIVKQLKDYFRGVDVLSDIIIAYEPIWAVGTGIIPTNETVLEVVQMIKNTIFKTFGVSIKVIYGGSVNASNVEKFCNIKELDGFLIGKASTDEKQIINILNLVD